MYAFLKATGGKTTKLVFATIQKNVIRVLKWKKGHSTGKTCMQTVNICSVSLGNLLCCKN